MEKVTLKSELYRELKWRKYLSHNQVDEMCHKLHFKLSNAERMLRPSKCSWAKGVKNENGKAIIGYEWVEEKKEGQLSLI